MSDVPPNGNGIPGRVLGWAIALIVAGGILYQRVESDAEHIREILTLRDRVHEAVQNEAKALIRGQDEVLQREMRLLVDALSQRVDRARADIDRIQAFLDGHLRLQADTLNGEK